MQSIDPNEDRRVDRRAFLKRGLAAGGAVAAAGIGIEQLTGGADESQARREPRPRASAGAGPQPPNILVLVVDQLRFPQWLAPTGNPRGLPPNLRRLSEGAVSFAGHYTASNDCTPARSTLLTGLYTHQTGCMITGGSTLAPGFPTWGSMLRERGYHTWWYGKWHLTHHDNHWIAPTERGPLERYGFSGGTYPSPDGAPGQGWRVDPQISHQFADWYAEEGGAEPWCTTVSFVNPHDIAWWYVWSDRVPAEVWAASVARSLPPNYETPELLLERRKPRLQRSLQDTAAASFGPVPFEGPQSSPMWRRFIDLYSKLQHEVDGHIGEVLRTLQSRPEIAANTVILFTSDHGEYAASHGLRGKGASAYEEGIRVPLIVKDPRGVLTRAPAQQRFQLTSSVDVAPLLLTIATGSSQWRREEHYAHLAGRLDLARILTEPQAPGRPYVLHATDEVVTEFAIEPYAADAPLHVIGLRTPTAKLATYSHWAPEGIERLAAGQETELYDYSSEGGRLELENLTGDSPLEGPLRASLEGAIAGELRQPLPARLGTAQARGFEDYLSTATRAATGAAARRKRRSERIVGPLGREDRPRERERERERGLLTPKPSPTRR